MNPTILLLLPFPWVWNKPRSPASQGFLGGSSELSSGWSAEKPFVLPNMPQEAGSFADEHGEPLSKAQPTERLPWRPKDSRVFVL